MSRAGSPPNAIRLLRRYTGTDSNEVLRSNLREGERWMAETLQSHLSHPILSFYRAQHFGQSWLVSLTTVLDTCALLIVGGQGLPREQARLTYRMGLRLLADLAHALAVSVEPPARPRLTMAELSIIRTALTTAGISMPLATAEGAELVRLSDRYDIYLQALSVRLLITLPPGSRPGRIWRSRGCGICRDRRIRSTIEQLGRACRRIAQMPLPSPSQYDTLSAMITPAIFLTANASLIISTSNRMSRVVDRIRVLNEKVDQLDCGKSSLDYIPERLEHIHDQFQRLGWRGDRIRFALIALYVAFASFVGTSLSLALDALLQNRIVALPVILAVAGVGLLLFASVNLVLEALEALTSNRLEIRFYFQLHERRVLDRASRGTGELREC